MLDEKLMSGKKGLVMGVANDKSISWAIAKKVAEQKGKGALIGGASLATLGAVIAAGIAVAFSAPVSIPVLLTGAAIGGGLVGGAGGLAPALDDSAPDIGFR